jgi:hypothetical protein
MLAIVVESETEHTRPKSILSRFVITLYIIYSIRVQMDTTSRQVLLNIYCTHSRLLSPIIDNDANESFPLLQTSSSPCTGQCSDIHLYCILPQLGELSADTKLEVQFVSQLFPVEPFSKGIANHTVRQNAYSKSKAIDMRICCRSVVQNTLRL